MNRPLFSKSLATIIFKELKGINKKALFRIVPAQTAFSVVYRLKFLKECELFFISGFFLENFEVTAENESRKILPYHLNPQRSDRFTPSHARCTENCGPALTHR